MDSSGEELDALLGIRQGVPEGAIIVICDTVKCPGSFLIPYILSRHLASAHRPCQKAVTGAGHMVNPGLEGQGAGDGNQPSVCLGSVCLVALSQTGSHYLTVARKMGLNPAQHSQRLRVIDAIDLEPVAAQHGHLEESTERTFLQGLYGSVAEAVGSLGGDLQRPRETRQPGGAEATEEECCSRPCLVVDDSWVLEAEASGRRVGGALDFLHYCKTLDRHGHCCSLVVLVHADYSTTDDPQHSDSGLCGPFGNALLPVLLSTCDVSVHVWPLPSGYASELHGKVDIVHRTGKLLPSTSSGKHQQTRMFRVHDKGIQVSP